MNNFKYLESSIFKMDDRFINIIKEDEPNRLDSLIQKRRDGRPLHIPQHVHVGAII